MDMWTFLDQHWFIAWCALWLGWGVVYIVTVILLFAFKAINRIIRVVSIIVSGWPPSHLDADGEFKQNKEGKT